jgi:hypothetical protein
MAPKRDWHKIDYVENLIYKASHIDLFIPQLIDSMIKKHPCPVSITQHQAPNHRSITCSICTLQNMRGTEKDDSESNTLTRIEAAT